MKKLIIILCFIMVSMQNMAGDWVISDFGNSTNKTFIQFAQDSGTTLIEAILQDNRNLENFSIRILCCNNLNDELMLNQELTNYFKQTIPKSFQKAMKSSGNLHNPALVPLHNHFIKAFKSTKLFKNIVSELDSKNYKVSEIVFEKFAMFSTKEPYLYHADIWLRVEKID